MTHDTIWSCIRQVREKSPLVHNITNYVVMNNTANALLAVGASPVMAHARSEVADMVNIASALVINMGTLDEYGVESMQIAAKQAVKLSKPWILDPVGAGATPYRTQSITNMLAYKPAVVRGNASEIMALTSAHQQTKGVDSTHMSEEAVDAGRQLSESTGAIVCISGAVDFIIDQHQMVEVHNGDQLMSKVTGMGCTASALIGAFTGSHTNAYEATVAAMALMGIAGELAAAKATGPGSLQMHFLDTLYTIDSIVTSERLKIIAHAS